MADYESRWGGFRDPHLAETEVGAATDPPAPEPRANMSGFLRSLTHDELRAFGEGEFVLTTSEARDPANWMSALRKATAYNVPKGDAVRQCYQIRRARERSKRAATATDGGTPTVDRPKRHPPVRRRRSLIPEDPATRRALALGAGALALLILIDAGGRT